MRMLKQQDKFVDNSKTIDTEYETECETEYQTEFTGKDWVI